MPSKLHHRPAGLISMLLALGLTTALAGISYDSSAPQQIALRQIAGSLDTSGQIFPTDLVPFPDGSGRLLVATLGGPLRLVVNGGLQPSVYLNTASAVTIRADNGNASFGLTALEFHPDFANPGQPGFGRFYTVEPEITRDTPPPDFPGVRDDIIGGPNPAHDRVLYEYQTNTIAANSFSGSKREVLRIHEHRRGHDVNDLAFDSAGYLLIAVGDTVVDPTAQELDNVFGTIMRIDPLPVDSQPASPDPISGNGQYRIPLSNPFVDQVGALPEIYAYGLRNPFRIFVDQLTDELWVSSNGASSIESVYRVQAGDNLGWPFFEGSLFRSAQPPGFEFTPPVFEYPHSLGLSVTGVVRYRGSNLPLLEGQVIFSDFLGNGANGARLFYGDPASGVFSDLLVTQDLPLPANIISINLDAQGEMVLLSGDGQLLTPLADSTLFLDGFENQN